MDVSLNHAANVSARFTADDYRNSNKMGEMQVRKRNGQMHDVAFDKILARVKNLGRHAGVSANYSALVVKIIEQLYDGIDTCKIDDLTAELCAAMTSQNPSLGVLAGYVCVSNHQKNTEASLLRVTRSLWGGDGGRSLLDPSYRAYVERHHEALEAMIDYERDFLIDYFGFKTLEKSYLMKRDGRIVERVQHMWMRVAVFLHFDYIPSHSGCGGSATATTTTMERIMETYDLLSRKYFTHATPTLFNAGTRNSQLSSCYLVAMEEDSIDGIYNTLKDCANISKWAGGIGLHIHNVRATNSPIFGTNGASTGIVPMLKVFNSTARYCNQGGKRNGSFAIYIEPWHADIEDFLQMKRNQGDEEMKARDLFYALWVPDLFMQRVKEDGAWHLFCPNKAPGLSDVHSEAFVALYERYVAEGRFDKEVKARDLWLKILDSQMETSMPYMLYKDAVNRKCNQSNLGTIRSSNLCTEITLYSDHRETAVCNLASVALNMFVRESGSGSHGRDSPGGTEGTEGTEDAFPRFDFIGLQAAVRTMVRNLNQVIDRNYYPTKKTERSNRLHRPIGIGVQGLADCFIMMGLAFESPEAQDLNKCIFEVIYYAALSESHALASERSNAVWRITCAYDSGLFTFVDPEPHSKRYEMHVEDMDHRSKLAALLDAASPVRAEVERYDPYGGRLMSDESRHIAGAYSSYIGSPMHHGRLQFDMWEGHEHSARSPLSATDWFSLREKVARNGVRNSMLIAPMPTASTSQIFGNNECFEPYTSNIYTRRTMAGEFLVINQHMVRELIAMGMWSEEVKDNIIANRGSVQYLVNLPDDFKRRYKTVWEISMKTVINMARDRGAYICQSQSMNLWVEDPQYKDLNNIHFYAWQQGLKTGMYYMRRKPKHHAQQFTIEPTATRGDPNRGDEPSLAPPPPVVACPYRPRGMRGADADAEGCEACGS